MLCFLLTYKCTFKWYTVIVSGITYTRTFSFYLWSISSPGRTGCPRVDLSDDPTAQITLHNLTQQQILVERVIAKSLSDNSIPIGITETVRASFSSKLWRMGKHFASLGTTSCKLQLEKWATSDWSFTIGDNEVIRQVLRRKCETDELDSETTKC